MSLITDQTGLPDRYEAIALPAPSGTGSAVFVRRSSRPSRRAVLHLHQVADSLPPADLVRWYNERGFHFYLTDIGPDNVDQPGRRKAGRPAQAAFTTLDVVCRYLHEAEGIDTIILSAQGPAALTAALWCDARPVSRSVEALILSEPRLGRARARLDIRCPVLVISVAAPWRDTRRERRENTIRLGQHVTWLHIDAVAGVRGSSGAARGPQRRRLFDEIGRWLGAYMYGQLRDQLL